MIASSGSLDILAFSAILTKEIQARLQVDNVENIHNRNINVIFILLITLSYLTLGRRRDD